MIKIELIGILYEHFKNYNRYPGCTCNLESKPNSLTFYSLALPKDIILVENLVLTTDFTFTKYYGTCKMLPYMVSLTVKNNSKGLPYIAVFNLWWASNLEPSSLKCITIASTTTSLLKQCVFVQFLLHG